MFDFEVRIAQDKKEIQQALQLRYEIFKLEMVAGSPQKEASRLDADIYDDICDHLIVIDKTTDKIVGTYRLMLNSRLDGKMKFYSEKFFDIRNIKKLSNDHEILELGRSCVERNYRSGPVINLLWSGIAKYVKDHKVRYLFGCPRLYTSSILEISKIFKLIKQKFYAPDELRVYPRPKNKVKGLKPNILLPNFREVWPHLPPLVKGYLRIGVVVCGLPARDPVLGSVLIFILLDIQKIPSAYKQHFL